MRDLKHLSRDAESRSDRKEPTIGKDSNLGDKPSVGSSVRNMRQEKNEAREVRKPREVKAGPATSRVIRDVLMDDAEEVRRVKSRIESGIETKAESLAESRVARNARVIREAQPRRDGKGITPKANRHSGVMAGRWIQIQLWLKKLAMGLLMFLAIWGGYKALGPLTELFQRPIKSVTVEGEFHFISQERATQLIMQEIDEEFLQIDLSKIKSVLLEDPWVEKVTLTRRWPDTLVVKIAEQKPIARWDEGFLNQRGDIVRVKEMKGLDHLPWLQGDEIYAAEILQQYQDLSLLLRPKGLEILALHCDSKKSWRLTLKNDVEIAIGRDQVMEKMRRFVTVYEAQLNQVWQDVKSIDVRYSNGVAVRWIEGSDTAKKMISNELPKPTTQNLIQ
jgi:cell division protein FtsQ